MFFNAQYTFVDNKWSLMEAAFNNINGQKTYMPSTEQLDSLGTISALYMYVNPPPIGYGTQAPKVAESIIRSKEYNLNDVPERHVGDYRVNKAFWDSNKPFPIEEIHGNFHGPTAFDMCKQFLLKNHRNFDETVNRTMDNAIKRNSDQLTTGRQTWCPITEMSVPCPQAYFNMSDLFVKNGLPSATTHLGWIRNAMLLMDRPRIKSSEVIYKIEENKNKKKGFDKKVMKRKAKLKLKSVIGKKAVFVHCMDLYRSFCSYIKHGERGKKERRAIASANVVMRCFLNLIEEVHLEFGKTLEGSLISIGGEEKKSKIILNLTSHDKEFSKGFQATQDATKWNENLSADLFAMFHATMLSDEVREELELPLVTPLGHLFRTIALSGHFLLATKMITLGPGPTCIKDDVETKPLWNAENINCYNQETRAWFEKIIPYRVGNNYVESSPGMLMGMHNGLSTTVALIVNNWGREKDCGYCMVTLRSSDDSMTLYLGNTYNNALIAAINDKTNYKYIGVNISTEKTMIFKSFYGEFTSWYQDGTFVSQYGIETTTLRPGGKNPADDFYLAAKSTSISLLHLELNPLGAEAKLRIGIENVRRLYRIEKNPNKRPGISGEVLVLSDGGLNPWTAMRCHLEETSLKLHHAKTDEEKKYIAKVRNPDNPFSPNLSEEMSWSKEYGGLVLSKVETPRNVFNYIKRANRSSTNKPKIQKQPGNLIEIVSHRDDLILQANEEALEITHLIDPTTNLLTPHLTTTLGTYLANILEMNAASVDLDPETKDLVDKALGLLSEDYVDMDIEDEPFDYAEPEDD